MSLNSARTLLRDFCKPVNYLYLINLLAEERDIPKSDIQVLTDSGEYGIGEYKGTWMIRKSKLFTPTITRKNRGISKHDLLNAANPTEVFSSELESKIKDSKWQMVSCPFHDDTNPSMGILLPDGGYHCMSCGERGGNIIDLAMSLHSLGFHQAITYLAGRYTTISNG